MGPRQENSGMTMLALAAQEHWAIEVKSHWKLDVTLTEDARRIWRGDTAENFFKK